MALSFVNIIVAQIWLIATIFGLLMWAEVGILVGVAFGVITKFIYSILHGLKSCNIEYGQWLALQLVKTEMGWGWHIDWWWGGCWCHNWVVYLILHNWNHTNSNKRNIVYIRSYTFLSRVISNMSLTHKNVRIKLILHGSNFM